MTRFQIALLCFVLYAIVGIATDGGLRPFALLMILSCGPLLLHYLFNRASKEPGHD